MTPEEAKKFLVAKLECMTRDTSGLDYDCNMSNCDECSLCYEQGNMGEQKEALKVAIEFLKQDTMCAYIRFLVIGYDKGKSKAYFETNEEDTLKDFVRYVITGFKRYDDMLIIDWQQRKVVKLRDYAREKEV